MTCTMTTEGLDMRKIAHLALAGSLAAGTFLVPAAAFAAEGDAPVLQGTRTDKTLVIGLDGARLDKIEAASTPNLHALMQRGTYGHSLLYATSDTAEVSQRGAQTVSGAGWSTILTGVWTDKHNVRDNSFTGKNYAQYPSFLDRLEQVDPSIATFAASTWAPITSSASNGDIVSAGIDLRLATGSDVKTEQAAVTYLGTQNPDVSFIHLDDIDGAGHSHGADAAQYTAELEVQDARIGRVLAAIEARPHRAAETWNVIVTADHGHLPKGGHGGRAQTERATFVIAAGDGVEARGRQENLAITDIAPTVMRQAGVAADPAWGLDGTPIGDDVTDDFDSLRPALSPRVDETGVPAGTLGFTTTPPSGWSVDNSAMPSGGVTEWRGWSFTTQTFWSAAEPGQARENFTRGRDVIAVADSDEWDDKSHGAGKFDSTLVTPAYSVAGKEQAVLSFEHSYRHDRVQVAEVLVSFDGGAPVQVAAFPTSDNGERTIVTEVPAGTRTAQYRFHYSGTNDWFWALDQVRFAAQGGTDPAGSEGVALQAVVEEPVVEGRLSMTVASDGAPVTLEGGLDGDHLTYTAALPVVSVSDTRLEAAGWAVSGQSTAFSTGTTTFGAEQLGWTPRLVLGKPGVVVGQRVSSVLSGGAGLSVPQTLAGADAIGRKGTSDVTADLALELPADTAPGAYGATLTMSLFPVD